MIQDLFDSDSLIYVSIPKLYVYGIFLLGIFIMYIIHKFKVRNILKTHIPLSTFPRDQWVSLIISEKEPLALRTLLAYELAYDNDSSTNELEFISYNLPPILESDTKIQEAIRYARRELELGKRISK